MCTCNSFIPTSLSPPPPLPSLSPSLSPYSTVTTPAAATELDYADQDIYEQLPQGEEDDEFPGDAPPPALPSLPPPNRMAVPPPRFPAPSQPPPPPPPGGKLINSSYSRENIHFSFPQMNHRIHMNTWVMNRVLIRAHCLLLALFLQCGNYFCCVYKF